MKTNLFLHMTLQCKTKMTLNMITTSNGELVFQNAYGKQLHIGKTVKEHSYMFYVQTLYTEHGLTGLMESYQTIQRMIMANYGPPREDLLDLRAIIFRVIFGV